jgi:hypothetical protein
MSELEQSIDVDYYKILGVGRKASVVEICAAYVFDEIAIEIWL